MYAVCLRQPRHVSMRPRKMVHPPVQVKKPECIVQAHFKEGLSVYKCKCESDYRCPLDRWIKLFSPKWKTRIICLFSRRPGTIRYCEFKRQLPGITDAVLSAALQDLVNDGLLIRTQYDEIPPRVDYSLSPGGKSLVPHLHALCQWSRENIQDENDFPIGKC